MKRAVKARVKALMDEWRTLRFALSESEAAEAWAESMALHEDQCALLAAPDTGAEERLRAALDEAALLIETGENRAMATDGPVPHFRGELDDREWRRLWVALSKVRAALNSASSGTREP